MLGFVCGWAGSALAVTPGQVDDFENSTEMGWKWGISGYGGPESLDDGGPNGIGDGYLQTESFGGGDAVGSRMVLINRDQWTGDYAGVGSIRLDAANLGPNFAFKDMVVRIAFSSVTAPQGSGRVVTSAGLALPRDSGWQQMEFSLDPADLVGISGSDVTEVMTSVSEMRILSASEPRFIGDQFAARLAVDNITAVPVPEPTLPMMAIVAIALSFCRAARRDI